jgi:molybdate transport system substrate-binding protein
MSTAPFPAASAQERQPIVVFAAASLTDALQAASDAYTEASGTPVRLSFASSSALARQIEAGARADVFFPADRTWMDYLQHRELIRRDSRVDLLANRLALIAPKGSAVALKLGPNAQIAAALGAQGRLATGDPDSVPIGIHAKAALTHLGQWNSLEAKLVRAENVRVALMYVARGEAALGIVYTTDAAAEPRVKIVDIFPDDAHPPITYPIALTRTARTGSDAYIEFMRSSRAAAIFTAAGFKMVPDTG